MADQIKGKWPGGPSGRADSVPPGRRVRTRTVEELEDGMVNRHLRRRRDARSRRIVVGFVAVALVAGGVGWYVGEQSHATAEEVAAEREAAAAPESELSKELNRAMLELWRMEDVEYMRNRPRP